MAHGPGEFLAVRGPAFLKRVKLELTTTSAAGCPTFPPMPYFPFAGISSHTWGTYGTP